VQPSWQEVTPPPLLPLLELEELDEPLDALKTQVLWHIAAVELHVIMQFVIVEDCASALPTPPAVTNRTANPNVNGRMRLPPTCCAAAS
jgi:hypothetical protein